jgi:hypothetical protein
MLAASASSQQQGGMLDHAQVDGVIAQAAARVAEYEGPASLLQQLHQAAPAPLSAQEAAAQACHSGGGSWQLLGLHPGQHNALGSGSFSTVRQACLHGLPVAVKQSQGEHGAASLQWEGQLLMDLPAHANIIR